MAQTWKFRLPRARGGPRRRESGRVISAALGPSNLRGDRRSPTSGNECKTLTLRSSDVDRLKLFYISGADGTGAAIDRQVPRLAQQGVGVYALYIPPGNRQGWAELTETALAELESIRARDEDLPVIVLAESFGACLGLRLAAASEPGAISHLVLLNSATAFRKALFGLPSLLATSHLASVFPEDVYHFAQVVLLPILTDMTATDAASLRDLRIMMDMRPVPRRAPHVSGATGDDGAGHRWPRQAALWLPTLQLRPSASAQAVDFRLRLMQEGDLPDEALAAITVPTLVVAAAKDRLMPSLSEGARLQRVMPAARRLVLPASGHCPMLESQVVVADWLAWAGILPAGPREASACLPGPHGAEGRGGTAAAMVGAAGGRPPRPPGVPATGGVALGEAASTRAKRGAAGGSGPAGGRAASAAVSSPRPATASGEARQSNAADGAFVDASAGAPPSAASRREPSLRGAGGNGAAPGGGGARGVAADRADPPRAPGVSPTAAAPRYNLGLVDADLDDGFALFRVWHDLVSPVTLGLERVPPPAELAGRPVLFVGNHTQMGMYDLPLFIMEMYARGYPVRGLAHPKHWESPVGSFFERMGALKATPLATYRALAGGAQLLLFPGGGKEVSKGRGQKYQLLWGDGDFSRLAARCNALVVPFAAVGGDDAFDLFLDTAEVLEHPVLGPLSRAVTARVLGADVDPAEVVLPLTAVPGTRLPSPLPLSNLERVYFKFGAPLDTAAVAAHDRAACAAVYAATKAAVEALMAELLVYRETDPDRRGAARMRGQLGAALSASLGAL